MLIIQRKVGERIKVGDSIEITVQSTTRGGVRLAITAPKNMSVIRGEVHDAIAHANAAATEEQDQETVEAPAKAVAS
ncbi:MAG: carbon storage regulator [Polyangiaceae bacterium]